jgi:peptide deformylase
MTSQPAVPPIHGRRSIVSCGEPVLRRVADAVDPSVLGTEAFLDLVEEMRATMVAAPGVGLAAPQIGLSLQVAVLEDGPARWGHLSEAERAVRAREELPFTVLVNPRCSGIERDGSVSFYEGCLSVPDLVGVVPRFSSVHVRALDQYGDEVDRIFEGWPARIVQHEVDHLRGSLYLDRVESRSISTKDAFAEHWAGRPLTEIGRALGFRLDGPAVPS